MSDHLLTITVFLPLLGLVILAVGGRSLSDPAARWVALGIALATFIVSLVVLGRFDGADPAYQMVERASWVPSLGLSYLVGIDGISLWMVLLSTFLFPVAILASWKIEKDVKLYMGAMLALETAVLGSFVALDLLLFFLFFEAILVPMYLLIGGWGGERRIYAAVKFFLYTMAGSAFLLVATLFLYAQAAHVLGHGTFDIRPLTSRGERPLRGHLALAVPGVLRGVRGQGAAVPAAHLAPGRPHGGADGRIGAAGRRSAEGRHVRAPALQPVPVPGGGEVLRDVRVDPGRHRDHLRRGLRSDPDGHQAAGGLLVGLPPGLRGPWGSSR